MKRLKVALEEGDLHSVAAWLARDGMCADRAAAVAKELPIPREMHHSWSDATCAMWLRNRMFEQFPRWFHGGGVIPDGDNYTVELHTFFIHIEETPSMLARLCNEEKKPPKGASRSRITRETKVLSPINKVAGRVMKTR